MRFSIKFLVFGFVALALPLGGGCGNPPSRLNGSGSSFVAPLMSRKWIPAYSRLSGVEIDYTASGSGDGVTKMIDDQNDFGCTDAPMNAEQIQKAGGPDAVLHVPLVVGAVVPIYNLDGVKGPLRFTGPVLARIYQGEIKNWKHDELVKLNPDAGLPDLPISVVSRADTSGTSYIWTDYLSAVSTKWKNTIGAQVKPKWPVGSSALKNPGVAKQVADTKGAIGYVELIYAQGKPELRMGVVRNADDSAYVTPSLQSAAAAAAALKKVRADLRISLVNLPGKDAYPITGVTWAVVKVKQPAGKAGPLKDFLRWVIHDGQQYCNELHYARVPPRVVEMADRKIEQIQ